MAKFLIMTGPYAGHVTPFLPIARRLMERGHEVVWITGRQYKARVESTGARFHPLPKESDPNGMEVYDFYPDLKRLKGLAQIRWWVKHVFIDACPREIQVIDEVLTDFPADVLVGDTVTYSLYLRSEMRGPPSAQISVLPPCLPSCDTAPYGLGLLPGKSCITRARNRLLNVLILRVLLRDVTTHANRIRKKLGLTPSTGPLFSSMFQIPSSIMAISTPAFEYARRNQPGHFHFIGPILLEPDRGFQPPPWWSNLSGLEPVVLVNQGTIATVLDDLIVPAIQGLKDQQMQVVAVPVKEGQLGELPANVHADVFIPFDHLLPHVDVMVTNGGYGGTQLALAHGVPLVVAGETEDKREVAARVEWSGAGINLRNQRPSPQAIREAVKKVLENPVYAENAKRIQADFAKYDAPTRAAELLEALAHGEKPRHVGN
jgi:MGT family glycosyltransferase